ncbi:MAG TPA: PAS domain S-box protein, partial [Dehalococcoidia bacterium]|nr:PAS domain S-box protein [Dehalococcoidia bacterium]
MVKKAGHVRKSSKAAPVASSTRLLRRLSAFMESSIDAFFMFDKNLNFVSINPAARELFGLSEQEVLGRNVADIVPGIKETGVYDKYLSVIKTGVPLPLDDVAPGSRFGDVRVNVKAFKVGSGLGIIATDISERKHAEEELRSKEEHFRSLIENSLDAIGVLNADGTLRYQSPSIQRLMGYMTKERINKQPFDVVHPDDLPDALKLFNQLVQYPGDTIRHEVRIQYKDGSWHTLEVMARNLIDDPVVNGIVANLRDITERKEMEEALRGQEEYFRTLIESASDAVVIINESGTLLYESPAMARILGLEPGERIGETGFDFIHPEDMQNAATSFERLMEKPGTNINLEVRGLHKDGSWRMLEAVGRNLIDDPVVKGIIVNFRDITERKEMETELRESEEFSSSLLRDSPNPVMVINPDSTIGYINPALEELTGFSAEEVLGLPIPYPWWTEETGGITAEAIQKSVVSELTGLRKVFIEELLQKKNGARFWVQVSVTVIERDGELKYYLSNWVDITERKRMEDALRQSEFNYRLLLDSTLDGLIVVDAETMKVVFGNKRAARLYGFDTVEAGIGVDIIDFVHPKDREQVIKGFSEDVFVSDRRQRYEIRTKTMDGREIWVSALATRIEYEGRLAVLLSVRDITDRREAEEERQRLEEQVQLAGRLAAVGELAAGVAHELNNPLTAVQGFAELLTSRKDLKRSVRGDVNAIYREAQRASRITSNLLTFARRHKPEKSLISINEPLEKSLELHEYRMRVNNIEVQRDLDPNLPKIMADFYQMQEVFINLLTNAEQAMTEAHKRGKLIVRTQKAGGVIRITFIDDGPGIAEEDLKRVFDPFFTTKEAGKGTGLGLSICYGLVESHGGHI